MPFAFIPFLLLIVPIVEIVAFILIGGQIGIGLTLLMILVTAIIGAALLRFQGMQVLTRIRQDIDASRVPARALADGALLVVAGILLLTPGFVTDTIGFLLFVPTVRSGIWSFIASRVTVMTPAGPLRADMSAEPGAKMRPGPDDGTVIDLDEDDYRRTDPGSDTDSPWRNR